MGRSLNRSIKKSSLKHISLKPMHFIVLDWPFQSANLNPIEHLCDQFDKQIQKRSRWNIFSFRAALKQNWDYIEVLRDLAKSIPTRLEEGMKAKGYQTKYWNSCSKKQQRAPITATFLNRTQRLHDMVSKRAWRETQPHCDHRGGRTYEQKSYK